jgi:hypothetical protein
MKDPLDSFFENFSFDPKSSYPASAQKAVFLARRLQERAAQLQTAAERRQQAELDRMLQTPSDKATLAQMTDQAFRTKEPARAVEHLVHILDVQGVPRFFSPIDRTLMKGFQSFGGYAPGVALPLVKKHMQKETANVILPGEREMLTHHLRQRNRDGVRMNVNFLGEAILSQAEAERRLQQYLQGLQWPEIEVVSIKISTLYSQISPLAREHTVGVLCDRIDRLVRTAARMQFTRPDGQVVPKFVYLDFLEFYRSTARWWQEMPTLKSRGKGVVVVVSPWNFPIAIPCGGGAAALPGLCEALRRRVGELGPGGAAIVDRIAGAAVSYERRFRDEFGVEHDHFQLLGQDNWRRYRPFRFVRVRVHPDDSPFDLFARVCAVHAAGTRVTVSVPKDFASPALKLLEELTESWAAGIEFVEETDEELARIVRQRQCDRVRYAAADRVAQPVLEAAGESGVSVVGRRVLPQGRVELLWYLQEQSLSIDYHRHGNLGTRPDERRAAVL